MDSAKRKTISVVMCTYNGSRYMREQLDSIVGQTCPIDEMIIQDDCSTDDTVSIAREYASRYPFIRVTVNEKNLGYNRNFLNAVLKAGGDVISIADQDDLWMPDKLEKQVALLNRGYSLVFHNSAMFDTDPQKIIDMRHREKPLVTGLRLALKPFIPGHECVFTRKALEYLGKAVKREDCMAYAYVIELICSAIGPVAYIDEPLVRWRRHAGAATFVHDHAPGAMGGMLKSVAALFDKEKHEIPARYFAAVSGVPFENEGVRKVVEYMQGGVTGVLKACMLCCRSSAQLYRDATLHSRVKALFAPLHLLREGRFLIK